MKRQQLTSRERMELHKQRAYRAKRRERPKIILPKVSIDNESDKNKVIVIDKCAICLENNSTCAALPCGHLNFCAICSRKLVLGINHETNTVQASIVTCSICKTEVKEFKQLYFNAS